MLTPLSSKLPFSILPHKAPKHFRTITASSSLSPDLNIRDTDIGGESLGNRLGIPRRNAMTGMKDEFQGRRGDAYDELGILPGF
jgi:hypothetical protein